MRQPKWDKFEAALLIETYWNIRNGKISRKEAVASLSKLLRDRVPENEIDETYRNENGINMRLGELDALFNDGKGGLTNTSELFREMVSMYNTDQNAFEEILKEAHDMNGNTSIKASFKTWLSAKYPKAVFDVVCSYIKTAEEFCVKVKVLMFKNWYELVANALLAQKSANTVNANSYQTQATDLIGNWVSTALGKDMELFYGDTSSHVYTNKKVISDFEKIVFKVFPAAPEAVIRKITLYKSAALAPAYYGVSKTTLETKSAANDKQKNFNQQWQDCVDVLRDNDENVWDCNSIEEIIAMSETKVGRSMAALCAHLNKALTSGTVLLSDLWDSMQQELGYYDTGVCCYLIGFAMHFYIGKFTWFDGNNAHKLDEDTIPMMIVSMLTGKAAGMKLSSESDVEKRFKDITRRVFGLSTDEVGDIYDCRKNVKIHLPQRKQPSDRP